MGVAGNFDKLRGMIWGLGELSTTGFRLKVNRQLGEETRTLASECFDTGTDPYGVPWQPLKYRQGQILRDTGRLMNSLVRNATSSGFVISSDVPYAAIHQFGGPTGKGGATIMPKRSYLPDRTGLSPAWLARFEHIVDLLVRAQMTAKAA